MTTDIERQFFDTFGIPQLCCKEYITNCLKYGECEECKNYDSTFGTYPQITDRILLELICINAKSQDMYQDYYRIRSRDYNNLKIEILGDCICEREDIKQQVQALFEENNNDR
jgi:hypothetical protein